MLNSELLEYIKAGNDEVLLAYMSNIELSISLGEYTISPGEDYKHIGEIYTEWYKYHSKPL